MQISCGCCRQGTRVYTDYFRTVLSGQYAPAKDALEAKSGFTVDQLLPSSLADLDDCAIYCLGTFGNTLGTFPNNGGIMTLDSTQRGIIASWVNGGGKLLCAVDYKDLYTSGGTLISRLIDSSFYTQLAALISAAGGSLTFGAEDAVAPGVSAPWPKASFLSDAWTTGISGQIEYDGTAGSSITNGTQLFAPNTKNTIVKEQCGSGWVVCFASRNALWGNQDISQGTPTGYAAMTQFLEFYYDL